MVPKRLAQLSPGLATLVRTSLALWVATVFGLAALWSVDRLLGCPAFVSDSDYGESQWRWSGLAKACVYRFAGGTHIDEPGLSHGHRHERWGEVLFLSAWLLVTLSIVRVGRTD